MKTEEITWIMNRRIVMAGLENISGKNGAIRITRRVQSMQRLVESLLVFIILGLIIQT